MCVRVRVVKGGEKVRGVSIFSPNEKGRARKSARYRSERFRVRGAPGVPREHAGAAPKGQATHSPGRRGSHKSGTASRKSRLTTDARLLRMREMIKERCVVCFRTRIGPELGQKWGEHICKRNRRARGVGKDLYQESQLYFGRAENVGGVYRIFVFPDPGLSSKGEETKTKTLSITKATTEIKRLV